MCRSEFIFTTAQRLNERMWGKGKIKQGIRKERKGKERKGKERKGKEDEVRDG